jgi:hypothetical protein
MRCLLPLFALLAACGDGKMSKTDAGPAPPPDRAPPMRDAWMEDGRDAGPANDDGGRRRDSGGVDAGPPAPSGPIEGFGASTRGAESSPRGFTECRVTSLADDGSRGTLRDCLSEGDRLVTFEIGGTITLRGDLNMPWSYVTIDGETAPAPGITIVQPGTSGTTLEARNSVGPIHDVVIRYLRMDGQATGHDNAGDIWGMDGENHAVHDVVIEHVTGIAATDGVFDIWTDVHDVTVQSCLIMDTITALHLSGGGRRERISFHHNVFARNNERQIRLRHDTQTIDYVNNVVYGWGWFEGGGYGLIIPHDPGEANPSMNVVNNVFHWVPSTPHGDGDDAIVVESGPDRGAVYFDGNVVPRGENDDGTSTSGPLPIPARARVTTYPADELDDRVVPLAGTHYPTDEERALLEEIAAAIP